MVCRNLGGTYVPGIGAGIATLAKAGTFVTVVKSSLFRFAVENRSW